METLENTKAAVTKNDLHWRGDMHPCPPLATPWTSEAGSRH